MPPPAVRGSLFVYDDANSTDFRHSGRRTVRILNAHYSSSARATRRIVNDSCRDTRARYTFRSTPTVERARMVPPVICKSTTEN